MDKMDKEEILSCNETLKVLNAFYNECKTFWERELKQYDSEHQTMNNVVALALRDIKGIERNPNEPMGKLLDESTKHTFVVDKEDYFSVSSVNLDFLK